MKTILAAITAAASLLAAVPSAQAGDVTVTVDRPGRYPLPEGVARIMVTNPGIADIQLLSATQMLVLGRMPGEADVVLLDQNANRIETVRVRVGNERRGVVTLYNGSERYSFRCVDRCEQVPMIGDGGLQSMTGVIAAARNRASLNTGSAEVSETTVEVQAAPEPTGQPSAAAPTPGGAS